MSLEEIIHYIKMLLEDELNAVIFDCERGILLRFLDGAGYKISVEPYPENKETGE